MLIGVLYGDEVRRPRRVVVKRSAPPLWNMRFGGQGARLNGDDVMLGGLGTFLKRTGRAVVKAPGDLVTGTVHVAANLERLPSHGLANMVRDIGSSVFGTIRSVTGTVANSDAAKAAAGYFLGMPGGANNAAAAGAPIDPSMFQKQPNKWLPYAIIGGIGFVMLGGVTYIARKRRK